MSVFPRSFSIVFRNFFEIPLKTLGVFSKIFGCCIESFACMLTSFIERFRKFQFFVLTGVIKNSVEIKPLDNFTVCKIVMLRETGLFDGKYR